MKAKTNNLKRFAAICTLVCMLFAACSPYYNDGRYRAKRNRNCKCPAYGYAENKNAASVFAFNYTTGSSAKPESEK